MRILIAYDGSPSADLAVEEVARRPWPPGSAVRLVSVLEDATPVPAEVGIELYGPILEKLRQTQRQALEEGMRKALTRFAGRSDLTADSALREGVVVRTLLEAIREFHADLVVAGSHGAKGFERLFLGSVSHALVTHAPCHVEIIKRPAAPPA
jgi:nucleotide-binding universal stress UspA family protein